MEWRKSDESQKMGNQVPETDFQTKDEGRRRKNFKGDQGKVEEDAITDEGREECREGVEDHGPGYLCWGRSCDESATFHIEMADSDLVVAQQCLVGHEG